MRFKLLPHRELAYVPREKLTDYLLSESHPVGRSKAKFFRGIGFDETNVEQFERDLLAIVQAQQVVQQSESQHGTKYVVDGELEAPNGAIYLIRTVWIVDTGQERPRFVTAYPA